MLLMQLLVKNHHKQQGFLDLLLLLHFQDIQLVVIVVLITTFAFLVKYDLHQILNQTALYTLLELLAL